MRFVRPTFLTMLCACATTASAQQALVLLDAARGGNQGGAHIADRVEEKQVTLATAQRLANLLRARGFAVEMTRDNDVDLPSDMRAALANTTHPIACVLLHAAATGNGVHIFNTALPQANVDPNAPAAWDTAQAPYADRSRALAGELATAFTRSKIPVSVGVTWMRPMDNMQCPAVTVEMTPLKDGTGADDPVYQGHVADVIAGAMLFWRGKVKTMTPQAPAPAAAPPAAPAKAAGQ